MVVVSAAEVQKHCAHDGTWEILQESRAAAQGFTPPREGCGFALFSRAALQA